MKYVVLRKRERNRTRSVELTSASSDKESVLPFVVHTAELAGDKELDDVRRDPEVEDVFLSVPFTLIAPLDGEDDEAAHPPVWGLDAVGATTSPFDGRGVTVAILDTGIDVAHEAFQGIAFPPEHLVDFTSNADGVPGSASDDTGHGTHVAATLFGRDVDGRRIGVARGVERVLIGKVLGLDASIDAVFNAINWALKERADIISMSLGMNYPALVADLIADGLPSDIAVGRALDAYREHVRLFDRQAALVEARIREGRGALLIAALGNGSRRHEDPEYTVGPLTPAAADGFISVGAVGKKQDPDAPFEVARFSGTGCAMSAPGVQILSAQLGGGLVAKSGTSMATPHVAGVAALWTHKLQNGSSKRLKGWARDVLRELEAHVLSPPGLARQDIGLGIVQAPKV
jgi:subtilisin family serine protease